MAWFISSIDTLRVAVPNSPLSSVTERVTATQTRSTALAYDAQGRSSRMADNLAADAHADADAATETDKVVARPRARKKAL